MAEASGAWVGMTAGLAKSFENATASATGWLQVACIATTLRHMSRAFEWAPATSRVTLSGRPL